MKTYIKTNVYYLTVIIFVIAITTAHIALADSSSPYPSNGTNNLNLDQLQLGDIIMVKFNTMFPGKWDHVTMFVGDVDGDGEGEVVEAWSDEDKRSDEDTGLNGVYIRDVEEVHDVQEAGIYRVNCSEAVKQQAIDWALDKAADEDCVYDSALAIKMTFHFRPFDAIKYIEGPGNTCAYTCGELIWAAYMAASDETVDIDSNDWGWNYPYEYTVNHEEIIEDPLIVEIKTTY